MARPDTPVLLISYYFPPHHSVGGRRAWRFSRHLRAFGWDPVVFCAGAEGTEARDDALLADLEGRAEVRAAWHDPWVRPLRALLCPEADARRGLGGRLRKGAGDLLRDLAEPLPMGSGTALAWRAVPRAVAVGRERRVEVVWGTGPPFFTLHVAQRVAAALDRPLVLDLRDPWTFSPEFERRPALSQGWDRGAEARLLQAADRVVVTTRTQQAAFAAHHPKVADRLHTIYTGYDGAPADPRPARRRRPGDAPFDVVHFGSFYGLRSAAPLLEAVAAVTRARSLPPDALRVVSFGYLPTADRALAERLGVTLEAPGRVPLADGRARLRQADLLFLPTFGDQELFIPGKLYDYLVAGRPVLALCRGEELTGILQRTGVGCAVDPEDGPGLVRALGEALDGRGWAGDGFAPDPVEITRFSAREATRALAGLLDDVRR